MDDDEPREPPEPGEPGYRTDSGVVELLADENRPGSWVLTLDRIRQSYVDPHDPGYLDFEYVQGFADSVDAGFDPGRRLDVTHVGGGALSFPRYLHHTRPGSSQIVLEPDAALTDLVRSRLPLPPRSGIRVRPQSGRPGVAGLADGSADLLVLDAFAGGRVPADLTTIEALTDAARVLRPGGLYLANIADGPPLDYTRRVVAGLLEVFGEVALRLDPAVRTKRFGNIVVTAARVGLPTAELARLARGAMFPTSLLHGATVPRLVAGARPFTDADGSRSPSPSELAWRVDGGW